ncbi:NTP transferase domain-containing protein, partial [bacterium]|nr:NTP transferase domain-containing protein [bacterium]
MKSNDLHKVCFPIDGMPAINRTVRMFRQLGMKRIVLVVGALAQNVIETVGREFPEVAFVYQGEQRGTGHAARIACDALNSLGHTGPILITMGDKVIAPHVVTDLTEQFLRSRADLAFVTARKVRNGMTSGSGRIATDRAGAILGNVEVRDIQHARIIEAFAKQAASHPRQPAVADNLIQLGLRHIPDEKRLRKALGDLPDRLNRDGGLTGREALELLGPEAGRIPLAGQGYTADHVETRSKTVNLSLYLASGEFWRRFLHRIRDDNAQREYYLTDVINLAAVDTPKWKIAQHVVEKPEDIMGFNSPDELLRIADVFRRRGLPESGKTRVAPEVARLSARIYKTAGQWLALFEDWPRGLRKHLEGIYGGEGAGDRREVFMNALKLFIQRHGPDRKVIVVRAPGRINLMGRHIDHRGGAVNVMAIDRDVVFVAAPREDDGVTLCNHDPAQFPDREFSVHEVLG